jgi:saccharopine dehydrogenase-like NADP-dependent oxidoreductase
MGSKAVTHTIALFGAGKIGEAITALLSSSGRYAVKVCDADIANPSKLAKAWPNVSAHTLNLSDSSATRDLLKGCSLVISALPFACNVTVAQAAADCNVHYADLTEDVRVAQAISSLAAKSNSCFMPQCGLAPGFISIAAAHLSTLFDSLESIKMRVGALPVYPTNRLKYNLTWSTDGLVNEYLNPCEVIHNGEIEFVPALEGYERLSIDGVEYEAFNTSGGLGSLCKTLQGKVSQLTYKTIRYPGHRDLIAFLMEDLKFSSDRETLKKILERSLPNTPQDKCIIYVEAVGTRAGKYLQKSYVSTVYHQTVAGHHFGAIQVTTASGVCGVVDLLLTGALGSRKGLVTPEEIPLKGFLTNEFGKHYLDARALEDL